MVCFLCLALSELVAAAGGSNVKVAFVVVVVSFLNRTDGTRTTSNPGNKEELGSLGQEEWVLLLQTTDVSVLCTEAIAARKNKRFLYIIIIIQHASG